VVFLRPVILRDRDSYAALTASRYDYVIGQQRATAALMRQPAARPAARRARRRWSTSQPFRPLQPAACRRPPR
jgi:general secretion pathway protein D